MTVSFIYDFFCFQLSDLMGQEGVYNYQHKNDIYLIGHIPSIIIGEK